MKFFSVLLGFTIFYSVSVANAQNKATIVRTEQVGIFGLPSQLHHPWKSRVLNYTSAEHAYAIPTDEILKIKQKIKEAKGHGKPFTATSRSTDKPAIGVNFNGNIQGNNVPPDNSMAVSVNGFVVSAINSNIIFANSGGKVTFTQNLADFYTLLTIGSGVYDPRIIYDAEYNRFIAIALHGNTPQTTKIVIAFSKKEDPAAGWYYYNLDGNPLGDNHWFDYPNVGLSKQDLFIAGLMRDNAGDWQYSILFQIDKKSCFQGLPMVFGHYTDLRNADGQLAFNLVPTHNAWHQYPDATMHLVSNVAQGGNQYHLHTVNGVIDEGQASISAQQFTGPQTELAPDGVQPNTTNVMNTFDSRIWNAMELNGIIHFGGHVNSPNNTSALFYGRLNPASGDVTASLYYRDDFDYGFPSIAAFGENETDTRVLINFLKTGPTLFPSQGAIICDGSGATYDWGEEVIVKTGTNSVNVLDGDRERWGDYSTVCRRFYNPHNSKAEVWTTGCFGKGSYGTWLTQYFQDSSAYFQDFIADKTTIEPQASSKFSIVYPENTKILGWSFEGGSPTASTSLSPTITYANTGSYDVSLTVVDEVNNDTLTYVKQDYITVMVPIQPPVANFTVDRDTIYQGESVVYKDLSTNEPVDFTWTFQNGIPATSKEQNPTIRYDKKGSHYANLTARNIAGSDNEIKQKFITVLEAKPPIADFGASTLVGATDEPIIFYDQSQNNPLTRTWYFEGGNPAISSEINPTVVYNNTGTYNVKLVVSNFAGKDSITKTDYVYIGGVGNHETPYFVSDLNLFPNPASGGEITVEFILDKKREMAFVLYDIRGQQYTTIHSQRVKEGRNVFYFSSESLSSGNYILKLISKADGLAQALPFVVSR